MCQAELFCVLAVQIKIFFTTVLVNQCIRVKVFTYHLEFLLGCFSFIHKSPPQFVSSAVPRLILQSVDKLLILSQLFVSCIIRTLTIRRRRLTYFVSYL